MKRHVINVLNAILWFELTDYKKRRKWPEHQFSSQIPDWACSHFWADSHFCHPDLCTIMACPLKLLTKLNPPFFKLLLSDILLQQWKKVIHSPECHHIRCSFSVHPTTKQHLQINAILLNNVRKHSQLNNAYVLKLYYNHTCTPPI